MEGRVFVVIAHYWIYIPVALTSTKYCHFAGGYNRWTGLDWTGLLDSKCPQFYSF